MFSDARACAGVYDEWGMSIRFSSFKTPIPFLFQSRVTVTIKLKPDPQTKFKGRSYELSTMPNSQALPACTVLDSCLSPTRYISPFLQPRFKGLGNTVKVLCA